jgi:hypothetical protein
MENDTYKEAERLTRETGFYHFADLNDISHRMQVFKTQYRSEDEFYAGESARLARRTA